MFALGTANRLVGSKRSLNIHMYLENSYRQRFDGELFAKHKDDRVVLTPNKQISSVSLFLNFDTIIYFSFFLSFYTAS